MKVYVGYKVDHKGRKEILKISTNLETVLSKINEFANNVMLGNYNSTFQERYISKFDTAARNHNCDENHVFVYGDDNTRIWRHYEIILYEAED